MNDKTHGTNQPVNRPQDQQKQYVNVENRGGPTRPVLQTWLNEQKPPPSDFDRILRDGFWEILA